MKLQDPQDPRTAKEFFRDVIENGRRHEFYDRVVEVATIAKKYMTGEGLDDDVKKIRPNETDEQKDQRAAMTNPLTPFALNQVLSVFRKTRRAEGIRFDWSHEDSKRLEQITQAIRDFYSAAALKEYLFDAFEYYTFWDPNAFMVVERMEDETGIWGYPFEVTSEEAIYFERKNGDIQYLVVRQIRQVETGLARSTKPAQDFYFYGVGFALHYREILGEEDPGEYLEKGYQLEPLQAKGSGEGKFYYKEYQTGTKTLPVFQFGVYPDGKTKRRSFVTPYEPAMFLLKDLVKDKSLHDLSNLLHAFPQKLVYGPRCEYETEEQERCDMGYLGGGRSRKCPNCDGKGVLIHTTEQDVILLALPDSREGFFPLSELIHYATTNEWLPKFQADQLDSLTRKIFLAVFQTEVYDQAQISKTATEKLLEWDKVYDTLEPFAGAIAVVAPLAARVIAEYQENDAGFNATFTVPKDYKMRGESELLALLAVANDTGAIPEVKEAINFDLLGRFFRNDPEKVELVRALRSFLPWKDKTPEQAFAISIGRFPNDPDRVYWENFDQIGRQIRLQTKDKFHKFPPERQAELVADAVEAYLKKAIPVGGGAVLGPGTIQGGPGEGEPGEAGA
jgi:hypothetical protein